MSDIPAIDYQQITEKYSAKVAEQQLHIFSLENIADSLRRERDEARRNLADLQRAQAAATAETEDDAPAAENAAEKPSA